MPNGREPLVGLVKPARRAIGAVPSVRATACRELFNFDWCRRTPVVRVLLVLAHVPRVDPPDSEVAGVVRPGANSLAARIRGFLGVTDLARGEIASGWSLQLVPVRKDQFRPGEITRLVAQILDMDSVYLSGEHGDGARIPEIVLRLRLEFAGMDDELRNARLNREGVAATLYAAEHIGDILQVCAAVDGDDSSLRETIMATFGFDEVQANAILGMQVRRLTPRAVEQYRSRLAELDELIRNSS